MVLSGFQLTFMFGIILAYQFVMSRRINNRLNEIKKALGVEEETEKAA